MCFLPTSSQNLPSQIAQMQLAMYYSLLCYNSTRTVYRSEALRLVQTMISSYCSRKKLSVQSKAIVVGLLISHTLYLENMES